MHKHNGTQKLSKNKFGINKFGIVVLPICERNHSNVEFWACNLYGGIKYMLYYKI